MVLQALLSRHRDLAPLLRLASPSFFDVIAARDLGRQTLELKRNHADREGFAAVRSAFARVGPRLGFELSARVAPMRVSSLGARERAQLGAAALRAYFAGLGARTGILDLRRQAFAVDGDERVSWAPAPLYVRWEPGFQRNMTAVYRGFYRGDQAAMMAGLAGLDLAPEARLFLRHFGPGDQSSVRFRTRAFVSSFDAIFRSCRDRGGSLHRNFIALGFGLTCLYDFLEELDTPLDVCAAYEDVQSASI